MSQARLRSVVKTVQILMLMTHAVGNVHSRWSRDTYGMYSYINIAGNFYNLIKHLYCNLKCSVKSGENKTRSFLCSGGVRQGCILSPLLFNFYILNNLPYLFENTLCDPFCSQWNKNKFTIICRRFDYFIKIQNRITKRK